MRLSRFRVRDYRSVNDSGEVEVEPTKTLLVGVNEAGKTALLKSLQQIKAPNDADKFSALRDYPRSRYTEIQRGLKDPNSVIVVEASFVLNEDEKAIVLAESPTSTDVSTLAIWRYLDNALRWNFGSAKLRSTFGEIEKDLTRLRAHLAKQEAGWPAIEALDDLTAGRRSSVGVTGQFATDLVAWLKTALPLIDEDDTKEIERYDRLLAAVRLD